MITGYDYSTREAREITVSDLFSKAKKERNRIEAEWDRYERLYSFMRQANDDIEEADEWTPPRMPDPWIQVESGVVTEIPEPEFKGRDNDLDSSKARQREYVVRYICDNNHLKDYTVEQEKRMIKLGDTFFKACWDSSMRCGKDEGDIRIIPISPRNIYPDPTIHDGKLQDCEFVDYVYTMHKVAFWRMYGKDVKKAGLELEDCVGRKYTTSIDGTTWDATSLSDSVEVMEHWFKQPEDQEGTHAGAVACSIQVAGHEIRYIPLYWKNTWRQNSRFPFEQFWRIKNENSFWNYSELFPIVDLVYAADRKLAIASRNDALLSNDVVIVEEGALVEGEQISNEPGAVINVNPGRSGGVRKMGGVQSIANSIVGMEWFKEQMERTTRNYETSRGKEASRTTTATGMAMLRADADSQQAIKQADRDKGYERLYRLLDWLALEFFDDGRLIYLGENPETGRKMQSFEFNSQDFAMQMPEILDMEGNVKREPYDYYPEVDVSITATDALITGVSQSISVLESIAAANVTQDNYKIYEAILNKMRLPERQDIVKDWRNKFEMSPMPQQSTGSGGAPSMLPEDPAANVPQTLNGVPTNV